MGVVWRALDRVLGREVALKLARARGTGGTADRAHDARVAAEFALLAELEHPGVVRALDLGRAGASWWMTSEIVEGQRLDRWAAGPGASAEALERLVVDLLGTLGWLHGRGLVHGDLKPANVLVTTIGGAAWPVLIDFGLAGAFGGDALGGTRGYLAPELLAGAAPTPASDLYALGVTLRALAPSSPELVRRAEACLAPAPAARPASAHAAAALLGRPSTAPRVGARDAAVLWGDAAPRAAERLTAGGVTVVTLPGDPLPFARAVAARVAALDVPAWVVDGAGGLAVWARLADALAAPIAAPVAAPSDQREVLDAFADAVVLALSGPAAARARLVVAGLERATPATRYVAARALEARVVGGALLVGGGGLALERGALEGAARIEVAAPDDAALTRLVEAFGVASTAGRAWPAAAMGMVRAAVGIGLGTLRALLERWAERGALVTVDGGLAFDEAAFSRLQWRAEASLEALWPVLWEGLPAASRAVAAALHRVGEAGPTLIAALVPSGVADGLAALATAGHLVWRDERAALGPGLTGAIVQGIVALEPPPASAVIEALGRLAARSEVQEAALARALDAAGAPRDAGLAWGRAAEHAERTFDWGRAAAHRLASARSSLRADAPSESFAAAARALVAYRAAGGGPALAEALEVAELAAARTGDRELAHEARLMRARTHLELGRPGDALEAADALAPEVEDGTRLAAELALVRGTTLARLGRRAEARVDLDRAMARFEAAGDLHAVVRVANNLGILAFHDGALDAAADAWARAARAKATTGDRRGQRIGLSNRGLALRERGDYVGAWIAATDALALATQIGDMVGRATGHLARAQLALDLGLPERAEAELAAFDAVPWRPELTRGDGANVRARLLIARGDRPGAAALARHTLATPFDPAVLAEAGALLLVADPDDPHEPPAPDGVAGGLRLLVEAARVLSAARAGRWSEARPLLVAVAARCEPVPPPAVAVALEALMAAADLLAQDEARARLDAGLAATHRAQREAVAALGLATPQPREARNLRNTTQAPPDAAATDDPNVTPTTEIALTVLSHVMGAALPDPARWAQVLRGAADAARCELHLGADRLVDVASPRPQDQRPRFSDLADARRLPFEAREPDGRLEALGLHLAASDAALFLGWPEARGPRDATALTMAARVADLALAYERARADGARLAARLDELQAAHRDEVTSLREALEQSQSALDLRFDYGGVVHRSPGMRRVLATLDKVTDRDLPVLVLGESGVGKELVARALHQNGPRKGRRFVAENCGAIPKDLFESTFFGHVKGAFTGALAPRQGLFEQADGGTLFLDEVGELPLDHQVKLLRVLQEKKVRPVGASREVPVDFRLVAATNRDLEQLVKEGKFREDLFYRLAVVRVVVPPLRERREDVVAIAEHLLEAHAGRLGRRPRLSPEAADRLQAYAWPGNVRELENEILRALALCDGDVIKARHLSQNVQRAGGEAPSRPSEAKKATGIEPLEVTLGRVERDAILAALKHTQGQKAAAARLLGLSRPGLDAKLARHGIEARSLKRSPG
ncbi:MAG: sigma 54-interacting transcriptional regulator [Deltaproteobacteria bacterium]|nr:sigma 54-interacting transcriptional regulator [Deltaproteobacteria bacterium]